MAQHTLLEMVNEIATAIKFPTTGTVIGNTEQNVLSIYSELKKGIVRDLFRGNDWAELRIDAEMSLIRGYQTYKLPNDFDSFINETMWDTVDRRPIYGPVESTQWQAYTTSVESPGTIALFKISREPWYQWDTGIWTLQGYAKSFRFYEVPGDPPPTESAPIVLYRVVTYSYISNYYVEAADTSTKDGFTSDDDTLVIDTDVAIQAGTVRMLRSLGLGFADEMDELQAMIKERSTKDGGSAVINMAGGGRMGMVPNAGFQFNTISGPIYGGWRRRRWGF